MLCVSSANGTVHIFNLEDGKGIGNASSSYVGLIGDMASSMIGSTNVRAFATIKLDRGGFKSTCAFSKDSSRVYVLTEDGKFSQFQLPSGGGQTCKLVVQDSVLNDFDGGQGKF
eukprot:TRINITY_DN3573_c0_g1_i1.p1 TRINITY_DN3573_c0_g1~~TRINITY_DN3573_c0_g1_i1.p1  ORF type:complete len:114 (-),score=21.07 TRINITY_DN3573_c0_g1_i1:37-378(-)